MYEYWGRAMSVTVDTRAWLTCLDCIWAECHHLTSRLTRQYPVPLSGEIVRPRVDDYDIDQVFPMTAAC